MKFPFPKKKKNFAIRSAQFREQMQKKQQKIYNQHIDKDGNLHLSLFVNNLSSTQHKMIISDMEYGQFLLQVQHALQLYDPSLPADICVYMPDDLAEGFKGLFLNGIKNYVYSEFMVLRNEWMRTLHFLFTIFILGAILMVTNHHLMAVDAPTILTGILDVVQCVMMWEVVDYLVTNVLPMRKMLRRLTQIGTARFTIEKWD